MASGPRLLSIELQGYRDVKGKFARATQEVTDATREELRGLGQKAVGLLQDEAPVRTGRLRKGIRYNTSMRPKGLRLNITSEAPYTKYVIHGRGPVVAKRAKALRFEPGPPGSGFIYRKRVGPAKANPFQERAFDKLTKQDEPHNTGNRIASRIKRAWEYS